jgi:hypothetical protein
MPTNAPTNAPTDAPTLAEHIILTLVSSCSFEADETCDWSDVQGEDKFDWTVRSGPTPSHSETGPLVAADGSQYRFIEASGRAIYDDAILKSNPLQMPVGGVLKFKYSMWGTEIGTLKVLVAGKELWSMSGQQSESQDEWKDAVIHISPSPSHPVEIRLVGICAHGGKGDIGIDALTIENASTTATAVISSCSFEGAETDNFCDEWVQVRGADNLDWTRNSGTTPSINTGPNEAADGDNYLYIEASGRYENDAAILKSKPLHMPGGGLLMFKYNMFGGSIGTLTVLVADQQVWINGGQQSESGDDWKDAVVDISPSASDAVEIRLVGTRGSGWQSDIAIDEVTILAEPSAIGPTTTKTTTVLTFLSYCSFEGAETDDFCGDWSQVHGDGADNFDWTRMRGFSPSVGTGPDRAFDGENYLYIEASSPRQPNDAAILKSKPFNLAGGGVLKFKYNMWGDSYSVGSLKVLVADQEIWRTSGMQSASGDDWRDGVVNISPSPSDLVEIRLVGTRGAGWKSDIAIDNVTVAASSPR